eukprot:SAG31_NODE_1285_length_9002_cov_3.604852_2_plen_548_part_00
MKETATGYETFVGSPFSLTIVTIDCCYGIADLDNCGMQATDIGDDCLCKPGYELGPSGACEQCKPSFYKEIKENSSCVACPPDTDTFGRRGTVMQAECVCQPQFFNISMFPQTGCYDQNFVDPYVPSPVAVMTGCAKCLPCTECPGDNKFIVKKDYWSTWRRLGESRFIFRCPNFASWQQCMGSNSTFECNTGYSGYLCSECAEHFILTDDGCQDCRTDKMQPAAALIQMVLFFVFVCAALVLMKFVRPEDMVKVKILIDFGQLMSSFAPTFEIKWPDVSVKYFSFFKYLNFDLTMLMKTWGCSNPIFATFYVKFLVVTMIPLVVISIIFVHWRVGQMQLESKRKKMAVQPTQLECVVEDIDWKGNCASRAFFTLVLLYLKTSNVVLDAFKCRELAEPPDDETPYTFLEADYARDCQSPTHYLFTVFALVMVFVYPLGIPLMMIFIMKHKVIGREQYYSILKMFGFLYTDYTTTCWYWGILNLMRKLSLSGMMIFFPRGSVAQLMLAMVIAVSFLTAFTRNFPFTDAMNNMLEFFAEMCIFFTLFGE